VQQVGIELPQIKKNHFCLKAPRLRPFCLCLKSRFEDEDGAAKLKDTPSHTVSGTHGGVELWLCLWFILALDDGGWLGQRSDRIRPGKAPQWILYEAVWSSILRRNCLLEHVIEGKVKGEIGVTRRLGRRRKKLLDDLKDRRRYPHLKEEALDRTMWRNRFGRGVGLVIGQITEWMSLVLDAGLDVFVEDKILCPHRRSYPQPSNP